MLIGSEVWYVEKQTHISVSLKDDAGNHNRSDVGSSSELARGDSVGAILMNTSANAGFWSMFHFDSICGDMFLSFDICGT